MLSMDQLGERLEELIGSGIELDLTDRNQVVLSALGFAIRFEREEGRAPFQNQGGGAYAHLWIQLLPDRGGYMHPHREVLERFQSRYYFQFADFPSTCMKMWNGRGGGPMWVVMFHVGTGKHDESDTWWKFPPGVYRIKLVLSAAYRLLKE